MNIQLGDLKVIRKHDVFQYSENAKVGWVEICQTPERIVIAYLVGSYLKSPKSRRPSTTVGYHSNYWVVIP